MERKFDISKCFVKFILERDYPGFTCPIIVPHPLTREFQDPKGIKKPPISERFFV